MKTRHFRFFAVATALGIIVGCIPQLALADSIVTYRYQTGGYNFGEVDAPYTRADFLSMTINFSAPLALAPMGSVVPVQTAVTPLSWSISDGVNSYSSSTCMTLSCSQTFSFAADATGAIVAWNVQVSVSNFAPNVASVGVRSAFVGIFAPDQFDFVGMTFVNPPAGSIKSPQAEFVHNDPAAAKSLWSMSTNPAPSVPEPASISLVISGIAGLGLFLNSRRRGM
jgi:hypothetical protein